MISLHQLIPYLRLPALVRLRINSIGCSFSSSHRIGFGFPPSGLTALRLSLCSKCAATAFSRIFPATLQLQQAPPGSSSAFSFPLMQRQPSSSQICRDNPRRDIFGSVVDHALDLNDVFIAEFAPAGPHLPKLESSTHPGVQQKSYGYTISLARRGALHNRKFAAHFLL